MAALLPDEILTEIFCYLPTKSIGRLCCVSGSWCAELSSATFLDLYRGRANKPGQLKVFFSIPTDQTFYAWQTGGAAAKKLVPHKFNLPAPLTRPLHGLVLIRFPDTGYHVCNPSTGQAMALPDTALPAKMNSRPPFCDWHVAYGLGYCSVTHEYKVVRIFTSKYQGGPTRCEVFVLGGAPYWRPTSQQLPPCIVEEKNPGVFLDGHLHFLCRHHRGIVSFDVTTETFDQLDPPPLHGSVRMTELDGCLCVYHKKIYSRYGPCQIWVLRDDHAKERRWEQLCRIDPMTWTISDYARLLSSRIAPLGMYNGDNGQRRIMLGTGACTVFVVDVPNGDAPEILYSPIEDGVIAGRVDYYREPRLGLFEESLAPME